MHTIRVRLQKRLAFLNKIIAEDGLWAVLTRNGYSHSIAASALSEMETARDHFYYLIDKCKDDEFLDLQIRDFLRIRWVAIKKSPLAYLECPLTPLNWVCERLAIDIAQPGESIAAILMPTIEVKYYELLGAGLSELTENPNRTLAYHRFIISHDEKSVIPIKEWFDLQDGSVNQAYLDHPYLTGPKGEHQLIAPEAYEGDYVAYFQQFTRTALSTADLENLKTVSLSASVYITEIQDRLKKTNIKGTLAAGLTKLCKDCYANGVSSNKKDKKGEATHSHPHPDVYPLIREFFTKSWAIVSETDRELISTLPSGEFTLGDYFLVLRAGAGDRLTADEEARRRANNLHSCVEINASHIQSILNTHFNQISGISTETTPLLELLTTVRANHPTEHLCNLKRHEQGEKLLRQNILAFDAYMKNSPIHDDEDKLRFYHLVGWQNAFISSLDKSMALKWAAKNKKPDFAFDLIQAGADIRIKLNEHGHTVFHYGAADKGWEKVFDHCLAKGVDLNTLDYHGFSAIAHIAKEGRHELMAKLLEKGRKGRIAKRLKQQVDVNFPKYGGWTPLHLAVYNGHHACAELLLACEGIEQSLNYINTDGKSPMTLASEKNDLPMMVRLIKKGADLNQIITNNGMTVLHRAALNKGWDEIFDACLESNIDLERAEHEGWTALLYLARDGKTDLMRKLIQKGANVNHFKFDGWTALHLAIENKNAGCVDLLLASAGIEKSVSHKNKEGKAPLHLACENNDHSLMVRLIQLGADYTEKLNGNEDTIFHLAAQNGWVDLLDECIKKGLDLNAKAKDGSTALHLAIKNKNSDCVDRLLACENIKESLNHKNKKDKTPLILAFGNIPLMMKLIKKGADFSGKFDTMNMTLLEWYCINDKERNHQRMIRFLVSAGADLTKKLDFEGNTYLHQAVIYREDTLFHACLDKAGVNLNLTERDGWTALHWAVRKGHIDYMIKLIEKGADINLAIKDGWTALHLAVAMRSDPAVEFLLTREGIERSLNHKNKEGKTPFDLAFDYKNTPLMMKLINKGAQAPAAPLLFRSYWPKTAEFPTPNPSGISCSLM